MILVTFQTFVLNDKETRPNQHKDNDKDQDNDSNKEDVKLVTFETLTIENLN